MSFKFGCDIIGLLMSERQQNVSWETIIGELVDNAFDANAKNVSISFSKHSKGGDRFSIIDDGCGCDDLSLLFALGTRRDHKTTSLGRHGRGAKMAISNAGDEVRVTSVCNGVLRRVFVNYERLSSDDHGMVDTGVDEVVEKTSNQSFTSIAIQKLRKKATTPTIRNIIEFLSVTYRVGLNRGLKITLSFNGGHHNINPFAIPDLDDFQEKEFDILGHKAYVRIGIIADGQPCKQNGMFVEYDYRTISKNQYIGLGDDPVPSIVGWIQLGHGWPLSTYKDSISSREHVDELDRQIHEWALPLINKAKQRTQTIEFSEIQDLFNDVLQEIHNEQNGRKRHKARRPGAGGKSGSIDPTGNGTGHSRARVVQPGSRFNGDTWYGGRPMKVCFTDLGTDAPMFRFNSHVVELNTSHPEIVSNRNDQEIIKRHAAHIFGACLAWTPDSSKLFIHLPDTTERHARITGYILEKIGMREGRLQTV